MRQDWLLYPFVKCLHPKIVYVNGQKKLVPCRKCAACESNKKSALGIKLRDEVASRKYIFMFTLSYDEENVPRYVVNLNYSDYDMPVDVKPYRPSAISFEPVSGSRLWDDIMDLKSGVRIKSYQPKTWNKSHQFMDKLNDYYVRRAKYNLVHPNRTPVRTDVIDLIYPRDLQLFIKRFRKYAKSKFNEEIRHYSIGEYGTESLRPHFHCLVGFNSPELAKELNDQKVIRKKRLSNGRFKEIKCARCLPPLWKFGDISSEQADGNVAGYVANYVTGNSRIPELLTLLSRPRAYHSNFLGSSFLKGYVEKSIQQKNWSALGRVLVKDSFGFVHDYSVPRSYISRYFPVLGKSVIPSSDCEQQILECYKSLSCLGQSVTEIAQRLILEYRNYHEHGVVTLPDRTWTCISYIAHVIVRSSALRLSPLTRLLYASKRYLSLQDTFGWTLDECYKNYRDYRTYVELKTLRDVYTQCELSHTFSDLYYKSIDIDEDDKQDSVLSYDTDYRAWKYDVEVKYYDNVKHLQISNLYNDM